MNSKINIKINDIVPIPLPIQSILLSILETPSSQYRYFSGQVLNKEVLPRLKSTKKILAYLPLNYETKYNDHFEIELEEILIIPCPDSINIKHGILAISRALLIYNSLFLKGGFNQGQKIMIIGLENCAAHILIQIIHNYKGECFIISQNESSFEFLQNFVEENKIFSTNFIKNDNLGQLFERTEGLGVDIILDFREKHSLEDWKLLLNCIGINGRIIFIDDKIQVNPPFSQTLFIKNATIGFCNIESFGLFRLEWGKILNIFDDILKKIEEGIIKIVIEQEFSSIYEYEKNLSLGIKGTIISLKD